MSVSCYQSYSEELYYQNPNDRFYFNYSNNPNKIYKKIFKKYNLINIKVLELNINFTKLLNIINGILTDFCEATVIGYEKITNKYWCKIYNEKICSLHIELEIMYKDNNYSFVKIVPQIGTYTLIENFVSNFKESIELYRTSSFIRACLEQTVAL